MNTTFSAPPSPASARSRSALPTPRRAAPGKIRRLKLAVRGAVQGVGFRPFVYRLATELKLQGCVSNTAQGLFIEVEGFSNSLEQFQRRIETEKPACAIVQSVNSSLLPAIGYNGFKISQSDDYGAKTAFILPDIATCADCLRDILAPDNRRFRYPFTNCTNCGPRFSIIEALPYDRSSTSMKKFVMCDECDSEYHDPLDRRFHAQPNACPKCGPHLELWSRNAEPIAMRDDGLRMAANAVCAGQIVALKGLGGFQLIVDARNGAAVARLRERKRREEKPFALMYPDIDAVRVDCKVSKLEERLLRSPESPIVLVGRDRRARRADHLAISVAPRNPNLGVMLPYSPLHHLLMHELNFPIVATSGNLSDEPICIDEQEALERLNGLADLFLVHNRPIVRHLDDSVTRVTCDREMILRRARGYAPLPITIKSEIRNPKSEIVLAVGAHLKNSVALKINENVFVTQHIGDLETKEAYAAFCRTCADLPRLYDTNIDAVACDMHPDYLSTKYAEHSVAALFERRGSKHADGCSAVRGRRYSIQHHWAHVMACMAENEIEPPALGVAWDGIGYGLDGTIWGGEFLLARSDGSFDRVAHLRQFRLPGGEQAVKEPRRSRIGLLHEVFGGDLWNRSELLSSFAAHEIPVLRQMLSKKINAPLTSSAGRFFDAIASLVGIRQRSSFEGQAAMELEFAAISSETGSYPFELRQENVMVIDWEKSVLAIIDDLEAGVSAGAVSAKFHNMLSEVIAAVAYEIGEPNVVLSGGCFQNRLLTECVVRRLEARNFQPYWHKRVPPNDGGIALGQAVAASWLNREK